MTHLALVRGLAIATLVAGIAAAFAIGRLAFAGDLWRALTWFLLFAGALPLAEAWRGQPAPRWAAWWLLALALLAHLPHVAQALEYTDALFLAAPLTVVLLHRALTDALVASARRRPATIDLAVGAALLLVLLSRAAWWRDQPRLETVLLALCPGALAAGAMMLAIERDDAHRRWLARVLLVLALGWIAALLVTVLGTARGLARAVVLVAPALWLLLALTVLEQERATGDEG